MILSFPAPQCGQCCTSMSNTRFNSRAQLMRCGRAGSVSTSHSAAAEASVGAGALAAPLALHAQVLNEARDLPQGRSHVDAQQPLGSAPSGQRAVRRRFGS